MTLKTALAAAVLLGLTGVAVAGDEDFQMPPPGDDIGARDCRTLAVRTCERDYYVDPREEKEHGELRWREDHCINEVQWECEASNRRLR